MSKNYRIYFGKKFYQQKDGYWANMMPIHAHRWVWINHHGAIPKGMDIHHKDGDKSNNEIENLEMLSRSDHLKRHWEDPDLKSERRDFLDIIRPKVHEYLRSEEGRKRQSESSKKAWEKRRKDQKSCEVCKKEYETYQKWSKFCSHACELKSRWKKGVDKVEQKCEFCHNLFRRNKLSTRRFCSNDCIFKYRAKEKNR